MHHVKINNAVLQSQLKKKKTKKTNENIFTLLFHV